MGSRILRLTFWGVVSTVVAFFHGWGSESSTSGGLQNSPIEELASFLHEDWADYHDPVHVNDVSQ